jgi:hypothetical protein
MEVNDLTITLADKYKVTIVLYNSSMFRMKLNPLLMVLIGISFILVAGIVYRELRQTKSSKAFPTQLAIIPFRTLPPNSIQCIYQNGRVELEAGRQIWWSQDSRSFFFRAFQNAWEYCLSCRTLKQVNDRHPKDGLSFPELTGEERSDDLIRLDLDTTVLVEVDQVYEMEEIDKWDGMVAYQEPGGSWKLAGYSADGALLVKWVDFSLVAGLEDSQPILGSLSPDGQWAVFATGKDGESFESIWLLTLDTDQGK